MILHSGPLTPDGFHLLLLLFMHMDGIDPSVEKILPLDIITLIL